MASPLDGARLRLNRVDKHLADASTLIQEFGKACKYYIVADNNTHPEPTIVLSGTPDLPVMLPLIVSDAIHNMRAALDYIVFELARHDSGKVQNGTQFLIEDVKSDPVRRTRGFDARLRHNMKGVSRRHIDMIEALQPYNGVDWTKTIRDISNPDKHRNLIAMTDRGYYTFTFLGQRDLTTKPLVISPEDFDVDASNAVYIAPPNLGKPALMPTLRKLEAEIAGVLVLFKPEF